MSMGRAFDPWSKARREVSRRVKLELTRHGRQGVPPRGDTRPSLSVRVGRVFVYVSATKMEVLYRNDTTGRPYSLVYAEDGAGNVVASLPDLLDVTLQELRRFQVLEDIAEV